MNRFRVLAAAAAIITVLSGCGSDKSSTRCGLITGSAGTSGSPEISELYNGIEAYAAETSAEAKVYTASEDSEAGLKAQFDAAAEDKAAYVVCSGSAMEQAVFEAQNAHHNQNFLFFDGRPRKAADLEETIRSNTECIEFNKGDMGFLAGYAAVADGYRNIFYLSGKRTEEREACCDRFLQGAGYAMKEQGLADGSVTVSVEYAGSDALTPLRMTDSMTQYQGGAELIVTDTVSIVTAAIEAAKLADKGVATIGFDAVSLSSNVIYSAVGDRTDVVNYLLKSFAASGSNFQGGQVVTCGAKERAVHLVADYSRMHGFSQASEETILGSMAEGEAAAVLAGTASDDGTAVSLPAVTVREVMPVTPNAESGLASAASGSTSSDETGEAGSGDDAANGDGADASAETASQSAGSGETDGGDGGEETGDNGGDGGEETGDNGGDGGEDTGEDGGNDGGEDNYDDGGEDTGEDNYDDGGEDTGEDE